MYLDHKTMLSEEQAVTGTDTTLSSTNLIDLQQIRDLGEGQTVYLHVQVDTAFTGAGNVQFVPSYFSDASGTSIHAATGSPALLAANLTLNSQFFIPIGPFRAGEDFTIYAHDGTPTLIINAYRYLGVRFAISGTFSTGKVTCRLSLDTSTTPKVYPASTDT